MLSVEQRAGEAIVLCTELNIVSFEQTLPNIAIVAHSHLFKTNVLYIHYSRNGRLNSRILTVPVNKNIPPGQDLESLVNPAQTETVENPNKKEHLQWNQSV